MRVFAFVGHDVTDETQEVEVTEAEAEAAFAGGFAADTEEQVAVSEPTETTKTEEPTKTEDAPAAAAPEAIKDEWEGVSPKLRQMLEGIDGRIGGLTNDLKRTEGRVGALQSAADTAKHVSNAGGDAPTQDQVKQAAASSEKWKKLQEDFPDWTEAMDERLAAVQTQRVDVDAIRTEIGGRVERSVSKVRELIKVDLKHPDWETTINTPEFKAFVLEGGPSKERYNEMKALEATDPRKADEMVNGFTREFPEWWGAKGAAMFGNSAKDALKLLDGYAGRDKKPHEKQDKKSRLEAAVAPKGLPATGQTTESIEAAFAAGFNS